MLCGGTGCHSTGSRAFRRALEAEIKVKNLVDEVKVVETGCNGFCAVGPVMLVQPEKIFYQKLQVEDAAELVEQHLLNGEPLKKRLYVDPVSKKVIPKMFDIPFFSHQVFRVMRIRGSSIRRLSMSILPEADILGYRKP